VLIEHGEGGTSNRSRSALVSPSLVLARGSRAKLVVEMHTGAELSDPIVVALFRLPFPRLGLELGVISDGRITLPAGTISWLF
jgi:hypothetical protein